MAVESKYLSVMIDRFVPTYIRDEYPIFTDFIKTYLEFCESRGQYQQLIFDFLHYLDIDEIDEVEDAAILEQYIKQYLSTFPLYRVQDIDIKKLIKNAKDFYSCKGTERSFDFLFRLMNHAGIFSFYYPDSHIFRLNSVDNGVLSGQNAFHDNYYRAFYTYEIRSSLFGYGELKSIIENVLHPVGCKTFFRRMIPDEISVGEEYQVPQSEMVNVLVTMDDSTREETEYNTNLKRYDMGNITFEDVEDGSAGLVSEMDFGDWGDTFFNMEDMTHTAYFPHQLHVYRKIV